MKHTELPWKLEIKNGYATVYEANGNIVPELCDIEMGWTDTSTGNYQSPDQAAGRMALIVHAVNNHYKLVEALRYAHSQMQPFCDDKVVKATLASATGGE